MKLLIWTSLVSSIVIAPAAVAQGSVPQNGRVAVSGSVAPVCILGTPTPPTIDLGTMAETTGTRAGKLTTLATHSVVLPLSFCNFAGSVLTVTAGALLASNPSAPQSGFSRAVNYTATASGWAASATTSTSNATDVGGNPSTAGAGPIQPLPRLTDINVQLSNFTVPSDAFLVAGSYSGTVIVTLGPATSGG